MRKVRMELRNYNREKMDWEGEFIEGWFHCFIRDEDGIPCAVCEVKDGKVHLPAIHQIQFLDGEIDR